MNLHPFIVHFPIAILTVYCLVEFIPFKRIKLHPSLKILKIFLLIVGTLGAFAAVQSGEAIEDLFEDGLNERLVEVHSFWATVSLWTFALLSVCYLCSFINLEYVNSHVKWARRPAHILFYTGNFISSTSLRYIIVFGGLIALMITGALGGAIVYGPNVDPIVSMIYSFLVR